VILCVASGSAARKHFLRYVRHVYPGFGMGLVLRLLDNFPFLPSLPPSDPHQTQTFKAAAVQAPFHKIQVDSQKSSIISIFSAYPI